MADCPTISFPELTCPDVILPTKKELFETFDGAASFPARLRAHAGCLAGAEAQKWEDQADAIDELLDDIKKLLSQWDPKNNHPYIPGKEWEKLISRLREDYNMFVQKSILELIATVIPISFNVTVIGVQIDLIAFIKDPSSVKETIKGDIDKYWKLLPEDYRSYGGEFGFESDEYKAEQVLAYIKSQCIRLMNALMSGGFSELIGVFDTIWDLLGLPSFSDYAPIPDVDVLVKEAVDKEKQKYNDALEDLGDNPSQAAKDKLKEELNLGIISGIEDLQLFGFKIIDLIGGTWDEAFDSAEVKINRLKEEMAEFKENYQTYLMKKWLETVAKFLNMIGLGAITQWITFTFCDFLKLVGFPTALNLAFAEGITQTPSTYTSVLPNDTSGTVSTEGYFRYTATAGQTVITGVDENGNILDYDITGTIPNLSADIKIFRRIANVALETGVNPIEITDYSTNFAGDTITLDDPITVGDIITIIDLNAI